MWSGTASGRCMGVNVREEARPHGEIRWLRGIGGFHQRGDLNSGALERSLWRQGRMKRKKVSIKEKHGVSSSKRNSDRGLGHGSSRGTRQPRTRKGGG